MPNENKALRNSPRKLLKNNLSNEMFAAVKEVFYSPYVTIKVFSAIFLLLSYFFASYTTIQLILSYFDYGVTNKVRTVHETPAVFPKVSICNVNQLTTKRGYEFFKNVNKLENFPSNLSQFEQTSKIYLTHIKTNAKINDLSDDEKKNLGKILDDSMLNCMFNLKACTLDDFSWYFDHNYGNCYSFNSGFNSKDQKRNASKTFIAGSFHGLIVDYYIRSYENLSMFNSFWGGSGAIIRIDNVSHVIDHIKDGIFVSPGTSVHVAVNRVFKKMLPYPYSECLIGDSDDKPTSFNSDLYQLIKNSPYDYTQNFCLEQCVMKLYYERCGCLSSLYKSVITGSICRTDKELSCLSAAYWNIYLANNYVQKVCLPQCPLECYSNKFTFSTSAHDVLGDLYVNKIKNNPNLASDFVSEEINAETVRKSFVRINVFYESLSYTMSEEAPQWDGFSLIANIGGNLGLFMGVSFFSIFEIITTLIELYFIKCNYNKVIQ